MVARRTDQQILHPRKENPRPIPTRRRLHPLQTHLQRRLNIPPRILPPRPRSRHPASLAPNARNKRTRQQQHPLGRHRGLAPALQGGGHGERCGAEEHDCASDGAAEGAGRVEAEEGGWCVGGEGVPQGGAGGGASESDGGRAVAVGGAAVLAELYRCVDFLLEACWVDGFAMIESRYY